MSPEEAAAEATKGTELRRRQTLLVKCLGKLIGYAEGRGYELTLGEGYVQPVRKARGGEFYADGVHMDGSLHYSRLAIDLNLFVAGEYVSDSEHFAWVDLGSYWESLEELCRSGRHFGDANHLSIAHAGKA
mgnify:CR=1 FL=1